MPVVLRPAMPARARTSQHERSTGAAAVARENARDDDQIPDQRGPGGQFQLEQTPSTKHPYGAPQPALDEAERPGQV